MSDFEGVDIRELADNLRKEARESGIGTLRDTVRWALKNWDSISHEAIKACLEVAERDAP